MDKSLGPLARVQIRTRRLLLRELEPGDVAAIVAYQEDRRYLEHYQDKPAAAAIVSAARAWALEEPRKNYQLAMVDSTTVQVIGCIGLRGKGLPEREAVFGCELNPQFWNRGLAGEAAAAMLAFGRAELQLERFEAVTAPGNRRAQKFLKLLEFELDENRSMGEMKCYVLHCDRG